MRLISICKFIAPCLALLAIAPPRAQACPEGLGRSCTAAGHCPGTQECFGPGNSWGPCEADDDACLATPINDDFQFATHLSGLPVSAGGTTAHATREPNEPDHYTEAKPDASFWVGDHSVWYRWVAPTSGSLVVSADVCVGQIDSIVSVYTGASLTALTKVVDNNNDNCGGGWGAKATFTTIPGGVYYIAVADAGGARENTFVLSIH